MNLEKLRGNLVVGTHLKYNLLIVGRSVEV